MLPTKWTAKWTSLSAMTIHEAWDVSLNSASMNVPHTLYIRADQSQHIKINAEILKCRYVTLFETLGSFVQSTRTRI